MPPPQDDYDAVPYPCSVHVHTHPDQLAAMALLHGLDPAPVERCRVLEIGCNDGGNLVPMAYAMPGSEFVGFDLAVQPVERALRRIAELGLTNIRVFQADLMQIGQELGMFDYIIAHGVYAWVPEPVRDRLLALCRRHLSPNGITFISYNALPGGHLRNLVREILLQLPTPGPDPFANLNQAMHFLDFITQSRPEGDPFRALLEQEIKQMKRKNPHVLFHDELANFYHPVSFAAFAAHAAQHGLQYLSDSTLPPPNDPIYQPRVVNRAKAMANGDPIAEEQILDFARMRMYRETLLCHAEHTVDTDLQFNALDRLRLASQAAAEDAGAGLRAYTLPGSIRMESEHRSTILLMDYLIAAFPLSVPLMQAGEYLEQHGVSFDAEVLMLLLRLVVSRMVDLHTWQPPVAGVIAERPRASAICRQEAETQARAATLLHTTLGLSDPLVRRLLLLLDGTRDRSDLLQLLRSDFPEIPEATLDEGIEPTLRLLHSTGALLDKEFAGD